jgi:hypothetical protein
MDTRDFLSSNGRLVLRLNHRAKCLELTSIGDQDGIIRRTSLFTRLPEIRTISE